MKFAKGAMSFFAKTPVGGRFGLSHLLTLGEDVYPVRFFFGCFYSFHGVSRFQSVNLVSCFEELSKTATTLNVLTRKNIV